MAATTMGSDHPTTRDTEKGYNIGLTEPPIQAIGEAIEPPGKEDSFKLMEMLMKGNGKMRRLMDGGCIRIPMGASTLGRD